MAHESTHYRGLSPASPLARGKQEASHIDWPLKDFSEVNSERKTPYGTGLSRPFRRRTMRQLLSIEGAELYQSTNASKSPRKKRPRIPRRELPRKEVIQPHLPVQLPCYDFVPVTSPALGAGLLTVGCATSSVTGFHDVTGGVYKARERIHRSMADLRLLATPRSCRRVAACNPNWGMV